jgi:serine/threonine protein kinase
MDVCLCDFGLSRGIDLDDPNQSTLYVVTRWYRSPELLLSYAKSSKALDIWSVGCIFAELLQKENRSPIFKGKHTLDQIHLIIEHLGSQQEEDIKGVENGVKYLKSLPFKEKKKWEDLFPDANPLALDLLDKLLTFNPDKRITAEEALKHEYFSEMFDEEDLLKLNPFEYQFDESLDVKNDSDLVKRMIFEEIIEFNKKHNQLFGDGKYEDEDEIIVIEELK